MRNLKRALSLALASVMVLSMMVIGAGAVSVDDFSDSEEIVNKEAVSILTTLNVINGKDDGSYDPTGIVTRAEMAKLICITLNGGKDPILGTKPAPTYTDIQGHWAEAYIEYCTSLGIISGRGDGTFDPNGTVTGSEAAKMLLVSLGYDSDVFGFTGASWSINVNVQANNAKLYNGLAIDASAGLTRDNAAQMVYNALNAYVMEKTYDKVLSNGEVSYNYVLSEYKTLMYTAMGALRVEGVVLANEKADITVAATEAPLQAGKTEVMITNGDEISKLTKAGNVGLTVSGTNVFEVSSDFDVLGKSVVMYVKPAANSNLSTKATVIGGVILSQDNVIATTSKKMASDEKVVDFLKDSGMKYATTTVEVKDPENTDETITKTVRDCYFVSNYGATGEITSNSRGVTFTAIDWTGDGYVDVVMQEYYNLDKVAAVNSSKETQHTPCCSILRRLKRQLRKLILLRQKQGKRLLNLTILLTQATHSWVGTLTTARGNSLLPTFRPCQQRT